MLLSRNAASAGNVVQCWCPSILQHHSIILIVLIVKGKPRSQGLSSSPGPQGNGKSSDPGNEVGEWRACTFTKGILIEKKDGREISLPSLPLLTSTIECRNYT